MGIALWDCSGSTTLSCPFWSAYKSGVRLSGLSWLTSWHPSHIFTTLSLACLAANESGVQSPLFGLSELTSALMGWEGGQGAQCAVLLHLLELLCEPKYKEECEGYHKRSFVRLQNVFNDFIYSRVERIDYCWSAQTNGVIHKGKSMSVGSETTSSMSFLHSKYTYVLVG